MINTYTLSKSSSHFATKIMFLHLLIIKRNKAGTCKGDT